MKDHIGRRKTSPSGGGLAEVFGFAAGTLRGWALILFRLLIRIFSPRGEVMDEIKYKEVNGTSYHIDTCDNVVRILESMRMSQIRIRVHYGDTTTGRDWDDKHCMAGYIGRSTGTSKIPILVYNKRSYGGAGILDHCIVRICTTKGNRVLYEHPLYHASRENYASREDST